MVLHCDIVKSLAGIVRCAQRSTFCSLERRSRIVDWILRVCKAAPVLLAYLNEHGFK